MKTTVNAIPGGKIVVSSELDSLEMFMNKQGVGAMLDAIMNSVINAISEEIVKEHGAEIIAKIDQRAIAVAALAKSAAMIAEKIK